MNINLVINQINILNLMVWLCSSALIVSVIADFLLYQENDNTKKVKKSKVATWNMSLLFFVIYLLIISNTWKLYIPDNYKIIIITIWIILTIIWTIFNIIWRFYLSNNWANHIKIYDNHSLVTSWPYKIVRHPLYASLIWFWLWVWLVYSNILVIVLISFVFIPMMYYRARQEEILLSERFKEYTDYKKKVWMFFPKIF